ncbi:hypothetical protein RJ035_000550 [Blastomyces gilchristii]
MEIDESMSEDEDGAGDAIKTLGNEKLVDILVHSKPNWLGKEYLRMCLLCALVFLTSTMNVPPTGNAGTGIVFAIFNVGQMIGAVFIWIADWKGRQLPIFLGCFGVCITTIPTASGRFLLSFFAIIACTAAPLYIIDLAPPQYRATVAGMYNTFYYVDSIIATSSVYGNHKHLAHLGNSDWRVPLWIQMLCPRVQLIRLMGKERDDKARAILAKYHANGDFNHPLVKLEMDEMAESLSKEDMLTWRNFFDIRVLFKSRSRRYRTMLNVSFSWFGPFSGSDVASYYLPYLLENVRVTDTDAKLLLNIVYAITGWIPAMVGARCHDIIGRCKMFLGCTAGMAVCLEIVAGTHTGRAGRSL